jgi:phosphoribulokinase
MIISSCTTKTIRAPSFQRRWHSKMPLAVQLIFTPLILHLMDRKGRAS